MIIGKNFIFKENDYFFKPAKKIPVLLGDAYKKFYSVNDEFRGIYLSRNLKFVVKGFLKNNAALYVGEDKIDLNSYIVFPALNIDFKEGKSNLFYKILYLEKVEGVIRCDSREEYKVAVKEIKSISQSTGFMYEKHLLDMYQEIELDEVVLSAGILIFLLVMLIFKIKKHYKRKEK